MSIFSLGRTEFALKGPGSVAVPNGYNQRFYLGENIHSFVIFIFLKNGTFCCKIFLL
jgi:hypothetical protein